MAGNVQEKQLRWYNIALMSFITVWGFGNVVNNYATRAGGVFHGCLSLRSSFTPYALIVGQLGSTFKDGKGGVSTWIKHTMDPDWLTSPRGPTGWCIFPIWHKNPRQY